MSKLPRLNTVLEAIEKQNTLIKKLCDYENVAKYYGFGMQGIYVKEIDRSVIYIATPEEIELLDLLYSSSQTLELSFNDYKESFYNPTVKSEFKFYFEVEGNARANSEVLQEILNELEERKFIEKINSIR